MRRTLLFALSLLAVAALAACGGGDAKPTDKGLRDTAQKFYDAITRNDGNAACALMTKKLRGAVEDYGRATRVQCNVAIVRFVPANAKVVEARRDGKSGEVDLEAPRARKKSELKDPRTQAGGKATAMLKFTGGEWRVDNPGAFAPAPGS